MTEKKGSRVSYVPLESDAGLNDVVGLGEVTFGQIEAVKNKQGEKIGTRKRTRRLRMVKGTNGVVEGLPAEGAQIPLRDLRGVVEQTQFHNLEKAAEKNKRRAKKRNTPSKPTG